MSERVREREREQEMERETEGGGGTGGERGGGWTAGVGSTEARQSRW